MHSKLDERTIVPTKWTTQGTVECIAGSFNITTENDCQSEITFDYERAEGGMPFLEISKVSSNGVPVEVDIVFSETCAGMQSATGKRYWT
jgi:hypothetical protein